MGISAARRTFTCQTQTCPRCRLQDTKSKTCLFFSFHMNFRRNKKYCSCINQALLASIIMRLKTGQRLFPHKILKRHHTATSCRDIFHLERFSETSISHNNGCRGHSSLKMRKCMYIMTRQLKSTSSSLLCSSTESVLPLLEVFGGTTTSFRRARSKRKTSPSTCADHIEHSSNSNCSTQ
jgi:hypothetical protein